MIGGYAHLAYGFNYYGTVGSNRDEFVVVRKMKNIDWLDGEGNDRVQGERKMKIRSQVGMVLNLDKCIGCPPVQVTCKTSGPAVKAWNTRGSTTWKPSRAVGFPTDWETGENTKAAGSVKSTAKLRRAWVTCHAAG